MKSLQEQYYDLLTGYITNRSEQNLYLAQDFIRLLIQNNISPEEVIYIHKKVINQINPQSISSNLAYDFLIEVMAQFGLKLKAHQNMLIKQEQYNYEMEIAAKIQKMLIRPNIPKIKDLDIGMISVPIRKVNGDYVHFMEDDKKIFSVAVADVVGKGVPAALCMSIVKYGLDTLEYANNSPSYVLEILNRIIEKSIDDNMFVSLFYGRYNQQTGIFTYSSAGHEPAFYFNNKKNKCIDLQSKGLLLGILPKVKYIEKNIKLNKEDVVVIITDGVTDFKDNENFESRKYIKQLILDYHSLSAQQLCELIHYEYSQLEDVQIDDDFTVVIIKKL